jgi:hypothetical protein
MPEENVGYLAQPGLIALAGTVPDTKISGGTVWPTNEPSPVQRATEAVAA